MTTRDRIPLLALALVWGSLLFAAPARAFKPIGHEAIEALVYRRLSQKPNAVQCSKACDGDECRPAPGADEDVGTSGLDVLRLLIAVGALSPPVCFDAPTDSYEAERCGPDDPLGSLPPLGAGHPDDLFARQLGPQGQCFHFMAEVEDAWHGDVDPTTNASRGLSHDAYERCIGVIETLWLETLRNPAAARNADRGLYALIHAVEDSFSRAHTERDAHGRIVYLRPWDLLSAPYLVHWSAFSAIGSERQHHVSDERDDEWRSAEISTACPANNDPYSLAQNERCYSKLGLRVANAVEDLLKVTYCAFQAGNVPKAWRPGTSPRGVYTDKVGERWATLVHDHLASADASASVPPLSEAGRSRIERIPELFVGLRTRSSPDHFDRFGDALIAVDAFPPLRNSYPFVPLWGFDFGLRWRNGERQAGGSLTLLSALLPLSQSVALGVQPVAVEAFWPVDQAKPGNVEILSSLRASFTFGSTWIDISSPRFAWRASELRIDPSLTVGYAWDLTQVASLGESGYRNAGAQWEMQELHPAPSSWWDARSRQPSVAIASIGPQGNPQHGGYGLRVVFPELLYAPPLGYDLFDLGGALIVSTLVDNGHITTIGVAPRVRFYPWTGRVLGVGLTPLEVDAGDATGTDGTYWAVSTSAQAFLRLFSFEAALDVPIQHWRGQREFGLGAPWFLRFGWVQDL